MITFTRLESGVCMSCLWSQWDSLYYSFGLYLNHEFITKFLHGKGDENSPLCNSQRTQILELNTAFEFESFWSFINGGFVEGYMVLWLLRNCNPLQRQSSIEVYGGSRSLPIWDLSHYMHDPLHSTIPIRGFFYCFLISKASLAVEFVNLVIYSLFFLVSGLLFWFDLGWFVANLHAFSIFFLLNFLGSLYWILLVFSILPPK